MYLWGRDVRHPAGNLLLAYGCQAFKRPGQRHQTSLYLHERNGFRVLLHSTGVAASMVDTVRPMRAEGAWVAYLRPHHRLFTLPVESEVPLPCESTGQPLPPQTTALRPLEMPETLPALLAWVRDYEHWCRRHVTAAERLHSYRELRRLPQAVRWLPPAESLAWLDGLPLPSRDH